MDSDLVEWFYITLIIPVDTRPIVDITNNNMMNLCSIIFVKIFYRMNVDDVSKFLSTPSTEIFLITTDSNWLW